MSHRTTGYLRWEGTAWDRTAQGRTQACLEYVRRRRPPNPSGQLLSVVPFPELRRSPLPEAVPWQRGSPAAPTRVSGKGNPVEKTLFPLPAGSRARSRGRAVRFRDPGTVLSKMLQRSGTDSLFFPFLSRSSSLLPRCGQAPPPTPPTPRRARHRSSPRRALTPRAM